MGKGGKCLDGKGWKVPGCERVESALIGKGRVLERERTERKIGISKSKKKLTAQERI